MSESSNVCFIDCQETEMAILFLLSSIPFPSYTSNISISLKNLPAEDLITFSIDDEEIFLFIIKAKSLELEGNFEKFL